MEFSALLIIKVALRSVLLENVDDLSILKRKRILEYTVVMFLLHLAPFHHLLLRTRCCLKQALSLRSPRPCLLSSSSRAPAPF